MVDVEIRQVVDFETIQKANASSRGSHQRSVRRMEVGSMKRMVKSWEGNQRVAVVVTDEDSKMAKVIHESPWNVEQAYDANHAKKVLGCCPSPLTRRSKYGTTHQSLLW
jgi:phosphoribosylanthranilate isomerase